MSPKKKNEKKKNCRMVCSMDDTIETGPDNQSEELKTTDIATNDKKRTKMIINFKRNLFGIRTDEEDDDEDKKD